MNCPKAFWTAHLKQIGARDLGTTGEVEITDNAGNSWSGPETDALEALAGVTAAIEHREVWERLVHP